MKKRIFGLTFFIGSLFITSLELMTMFELKTGLKGTDFESTIGWVIFFTIVCLLVSLLGFFSSKNGDGIYTFICCDSFISISSLQYVIILGKTISYMRNSGSAYTIPDEMIFALVFAILLFIFTLILIFLQVSSNNGLSFMNFKYGSKYERLHSLLIILFLVFIFMCNSTETFAVQEESSLSDKILIIFRFIYLISSAFIVYFMSDDITEKEAVIKQKDPISEIKKLNELKELGILSNEEYEEKRKKYVDLIV